MVFNATFNNISFILWRSVLWVEETRVPGENHRPAASLFKESKVCPLKIAEEKWFLLVKYIFGNL
jgi:hypothetical protein